MIVLDSGLVRTRCTCNINAPLIGLTWELDRCLLCLGIEGGDDTQAAIDNIGTQVGHKGTSITHVRVTELSVNLHITSEDEVEVSTCGEVCIEIASEDGVVDRTIFVVSVEVRVLILLGVPMLSHHTQTRCQLDIKLHEAATDKRKHNVGIHGYHVTHHVILKVHVRKTHTKSGIVQVLLPRTLLHSRELDTEVQTTILVQTESNEVVILVEVRALECLYLDGILRLVIFILR